MESAYGGSHIVCWIPTLFVTKSVRTTACSSSKLTNLVYLEKRLTLAYFIIVNISILGYGFTNKDMTCFVGYSIKFKLVICYLFMASVVKYYLCREKIYIKSRAVKMEVGLNTSSNKCRFRLVWAVRAD